MPEVISDMANQYKIIDEFKWERAMHCMVFRNSVEPAFCVTFEVDVTGFKNMVKDPREIQSHPCNHRQRYPQHP